MEGFDDMAFEDLIGALRENPAAAGIDPNHHHKPEDERIFVFGSNFLGQHGAGAAWYAHSKLGAEMGVGEGPTGRTYALPTCFAPGLPVDLDTLRDAVDNFIRYARLNPQLRFFVSEVGCGIAGFYVREVAELFDGAPPNCDLPPSFHEYYASCQCDMCGQPGCTSDHVGDIEY